MAGPSGRRLALQSDRVPPGMEDRKHERGRDQECGQEHCGTRAIGVSAAIMAQPGCFALACPTTQSTNWRTSRLIRVCFGYTR